MNILFIGYWAFHDGLTSSTILPHLELLSGFSEVEKVVFTSIERNTDIKTFQLQIDKVEHIPLYSSNSKNVFKNKIHDFTVFPKRLIQLARDNNIDKIICRGAPAGALGFMVWQKTNIPFVVESFEPHADYMCESGVWSKFDPRYLLQRYWEKKQKKYAQSIVTVSNNYFQKLLDEGVNRSRLHVVPCTVNLNTFHFNELHRDEIRVKHNIDKNSIVGIYVGKFGGIYLDEEAFDVFRDTLSLFHNPVLILLTPDNPQEIEEKAKTAGLSDIVRLVILLAKHDEVSKYLSASDIGFATIKPALSRRYCSAIKVGEYYASGLPTIITQGVGDDSQIIENEGAGVVLDEKFCLDSKKLIDLIKNTPKSHFRSIAEKYRNPDIDLEVYKRILF